MWEGVEESVNGKIENGGELVRKAEDGDVECLAPLFIFLYFLPLLYSSFPALYILYCLTFPFSSFSSYLLLRLRLFLAHLTLALHSLPHYLYTQSTASRFVPMSPCFSLTAAFHNLPLFPPVY